MSFVCSIPVIASLFSCTPATPRAVGYVEGEYVLLAPIETAQVVSVMVRRGDRFDKGAELARLEDRDTEIAVAQAQAALAQAKAQLADLRKGKRPEEIAVLETTLRSAEVQADDAKRTLKRTTDLNKRGIATQAELDKARTAADLADARVGEAKANLAVAALPARAETIEAAESQVEQAKAALEQAEWRYANRTIVAPAAGRIFDVIRDAGDIAGPAAPMLSMLPDGAVKLKLYVPEALFSSVAVGDVMPVSCDGCRGGLTARVSYVSPDPEFTPPVIYSLETRQKLVHLIEARPEDGADALKPGQIVDARLPEPRP